MWQTMFLDWAPRFEMLPETLIDLSNRQKRYEEETAAYETSLEEAVKEQQIKRRINTALGVGGGVILGILIKAGIDWVQDG